MAGYRFCRSDDAPRLVEAYNACYRAHFPELPELTLDGFKRSIREIQVWPSSCMIASVDRGQPIGVLIGAKRESASSVVALGVHPDHLRQGHGSHMLSSLASKLAILGPPRIVAEVPEPLGGARAVFEACGFRAGATYTDFVLDRDPGAAPPRHPLVAAVGFEDALAAGALDRAGHEVAWDREIESLAGKAIRGLAIASEARIEAALLYSLAEETGETCRIERVSIADPAKQEALFGALLGQLRAQVRARVTFPRVHPAEFRYELLGRMGFSSGSRTVGYELDARAHVSGHARLTVE